MSCSKRMKPLLVGTWAAQPTTSTTTRTTTVMPLAPPTPDATQVADIETHTRASTEDYCSVNGGQYGFDIRGGDVLYPANDTFDAPGIAEDLLHPPHRPRPPGSLRVQRILRSVGQCLRRFFPK
ncbi:hypothetical protein B0H15DRAFT_949683 [Mycena belliarum]|uniref:Uncharacterized protein n=1 Tax=Mycena belliarum TaxID=1033014 RepID=A0AAD6U2U8_9AGAR|nr:hypothetical protein B0H15DRAFT_949683 [Mycena belliae]